MRQLVVMEEHPNSKEPWVGKVGNEDEIFAYLKENEAQGNLDYLAGIFELKEKAGDEIMDWVEFDDYQPVKVKDRG